MPISYDEWNSGRANDTIEGRIITFLKQNKKAFTTVEVMNGLGYITDMKDLGTLFVGMLNIWNFQNALDKLVKERTVEARVVKQPNITETYYKIAEPEKRNFTVERL